MRFGRKGIEQGFGLGNLVIMTPVLEGAGHLDPFHAARVQLMARCLWSCTYALVSGAMSPPTTSCSLRGCCMCPAQASGGGLWQPRKRLGAVELGHRCRGAGRQGAPRAARRCKKPITLNHSLPQASCQASCMARVASGQGARMSPAASVPSQHRHRQPGRSRQVVVQACAPCMRRQRGM